MHVSRREFHKLTLFTSAIILASIPLTVNSLIRVQPQTSLADNSQANAPLMSPLSDKAETSPPQARTLTVNSTAVATVYQTDISVNARGNQFLEVGGPSKAQSYVKFDLQDYDIKTVYAAKLRFKVSTSENTPIIVSAVGNDWIESIVTYETRPETLMRLGTVANAGNGVWFEIDIKDYLAANKEKAISVALSGSSSKVTEIHSQDGVNSPKILLTVK